MNERSGPAGAEGPAVAAAPAQAARAGGNKQEKTDEITNYEISKIVNKTVMPVGEIKKLSIAVLVDGNYVKNAKGAEEYQARSKKELADLEDLVKKSAGFDAKRDDQIVVNNIPFKKVDVEEEDESTHHGAGHPVLSAHEVYRAYRHRGDGLFPFPHAHGLNPSESEVALRGSRRRRSKVP